MFRAALSSSLNNCLARSRAIRNGSCLAFLFHVIHSERELAELFTGFWLPGMRVKHVETIIFEFQGRLKLDAEALKTVASVALPQRQSIFETKLCSPGALGDLARNP